ncbi:hypothetical protein [Phenylobacterium sp.]|uniref:hypothetical protein n=1 Tax=Phenylobacterium sp. TaxID=1871053 RepID=UPI0025EA5A82|nr:hypothetical protein [Phenylobacterium sp.]
MANSTSASLKLTVQATGENSGTWGQITNTNLLILEQAIGGYQAVGITSGATLTFSNGAISNGKNAVLKLTGTIGGAVNVTIPDSIEKTFIVDNATTGAYTVTFKTTSGSGVTWAAADKGTKMIYSDGTNVVDTAFTDLSSDLTPQLAGTLDCNGNNIIIDGGNSILDESSNEQIKFTTTGSAVNEFSIANAATGNAPALSVTGGDTNIDLNLTPKGIGRATFNGQGKIQSVAEKVTTSATAATGTLTYDVLTQAVLNYTSNAAGNWTLNIRGDGSNSLDSIMDTGESITIAHLVPNGGTPYYNSAVQIDGSSVTPEWQGGSAPTGGNANSIDVYSYTIIKTGSATFTALASQTQFA